MKSKLGGASPLIMCSGNVSYAPQAIEMGEAHNSIFGRRTTDLGTLKFSTWAFKVGEELGGVKKGSGQRVRGAHVVLWDCEGVGVHGCCPRSAQPEL